MLSSRMNEIVQQLLTRDQLFEGDFEPFWFGTFFRVQVYVY